MARQVSYPGIYFDEFAPGAPIQPATTNIVAFIGPTSDGVPNEPVKVTSFDDFKNQFGQLPLSGFHLWYSIRGFYENGGNECYVVRVSNGDYDKLSLLDSAPAPGPFNVIDVRARQPGNSGLSVKVDRTNVLDSTKTRLFSAHWRFASKPH